jgi:spectinomycin phosphotransferase
LRKGEFAEITVTVPLYLKAQGIQAIITPVVSRTGQHWAYLDDYRMILYPFIEGQDGYEVELSDRQWREFGVTLKGIHAAQLPPGLERLVPRETFSPLWREMVMNFQAQAESASFDEPVAAELAAFMREKRGEITHLVERASQLAVTVQSRSPDLVLCHSDIHAGNLHITSAGALYIVDWDNPVLASKERDLMHFGGSAVWNNAHAALFYQGYGRVEVDTAALAYYRYERIIQDIAEFCKQLLLTIEGGKNRQQSLIWFTGQFLPGHEVEIARKTDVSHLFDR